MLTREPALAGRREWIGLVLLAAPALLVAMDITALFLALPRLSADLHASSVQQLWITDSYGFAVAGFVITMGTLGDRLGRRRLLLVGGASFAAVSVAAAFSASPLMLIIARAGSRLARMRRAGRHRRTEWLVSGWRRRGCDGWAAPCSGGGRPAVGRRAQGVVHDHAGSGVAGYTRSCVIT